MSQRRVSISLPLDGQGFLRRECPSCLQQFKWRQTPAGEDGAVPAPPGGYRCPYCGRQAEAGEWWTPAQLAFARGSAASEVVGPMLSDFAADLNASNRSSGMVRISATAPRIDRPSPLGEPDDMVRVDFTCHPSEPVKVAAAHAGPVHCLVCGQPTEP